MSFCQIWVDFDIGTDFSERPEGTDFSERPWRNGLFGTSLEERTFQNVPRGTDFSERSWRIWACVKDK
ncbi:hypothetical protein RclHR1_11880003 [Rhizophagus clarus]|uniref:Uncharacterized protein n=1 Tax=Rhizophagus clarus TaxID=94130 RepID=A0A2Z6Q5J3_9GLOM|nr:hypothetical protein RclHR1_11880003 [Rhizophagus clarus]